MKWVEPMEPLLSDKKLLNQLNDEWIYQVKWDGIRGLSYIDNKEVRIYTKKGKERTLFYPELQDLNNLIQANQAILDGEIIVLNQYSKPTFEHILIRERVKNTKNLKYYQKNYPIHYIVFDILFLNGKNLTGTKLIERKKHLYNVLKQNEMIAITDDFFDGEGLLRVTKEKGWEGIIAKKEQSIYHAGKNHRDWFKIKNKKKILAVVSGIQGKGKKANALLLGIYHNEAFIYIGKASIGLTNDNWQLLEKYYKEIKVEESPFIIAPKLNNVTWLHPVLTCWVEFLEWTEEGKLRHPQIIGFSNIPAKEADGKEVII